MFHDFMYGYKQVVNVYLEGECLVWVWGVCVCVCVCVCVSLYRWFTVQLYSYWDPDLDDCCTLEPYTIIPL